MNQASASRVPWVNSNGWRFISATECLFLLRGEGRCGSSRRGGSVLLRRGRDGANGRKRTQGSFAEMSKFLATINAPQGPALADIGFVDDGSPSSGEVMNLLVRDNLLFKIVRDQDPQVKVTVRIGSKDYPTEAAKNPDVLAHKIRANLTDAKRTIRIYGTSVVVARITEESGGLRLQLLNYGSAAGTRVDAFRVRVLGHYSKAQSPLFQRAVIR